MGNKVEVYDLECELEYMKETMYKALALPPEMLEAPPPKNKTLWDHLRET